MTRKIEVKGKVVEHRNPDPDVRAMAPYNFVPLSYTFLEADPVPPADFYHADREPNKAGNSDTVPNADGGDFKWFTGTIDITLTAKEPLFTGPLFTKEQMDKMNELAEAEKTQNKRERQEKKWELISSFASVPKNEKSNVQIIPGSTFRGMVRTLYEIVTYSKFSFYEEKKKYYFRSFADYSDDLRKEYNKDFANLMTVQKENICSGFLIKEGKSYSILPSVEPKKWLRVDQDAVIDAGLCSEKMYTQDGGAVKSNSGYTQDSILIKFEDPDGSLNVVKVAPASCTDAGFVEGGLIMSGWMPPRPNEKPKHEHWIIYGPKKREDAIALEQEVIENYKEDISRYEQTDLLQRLKTSTAIPCFYRLDSKGRIDSFGHTTFFRVSYSKSLADFVPKPKEDFLDFTEAVFGLETKHTTRVFFEDLKLTSNHSPSEAANPKILSTPKPTTFQHYLTQPEKPGGTTTRITGLKHYNSETTLRGFKLFWHKNAEWKETDAKNIKTAFTQYTKIAPMPKGSTFEGTIRFENLTKLELGALLTVLELPAGCAHKIGMGKPLGLGSVDVKPVLHLSDRKNRYTSLEAEWIPNSDAEYPAKMRKKMNELKRNFAVFILEQITEQIVEKGPENKFWEIPRLKELHTMLDYSNKPANKETEYMLLPEFKKRQVLPSPTGVRGIQPAVQQTAANLKKGKKK